MQRPGDHPAITAVIAGPRGDQHTGPKQMRIAIGQHDGHGPAGALHEGGELDAGTDGETVPAVGLFGGEDGDHRG